MNLFFFLPTCQRTFFCTPNGTRTRILRLKVSCPTLLDDGGIFSKIKEQKKSNPFRGWTLMYFVFYLIATYITNPTQKNNLLSYQGFHYICNTYVPFFEFILLLVFQLLYIQKKMSLFSKFVFCKYMTYIL